MADHIYEAGAAFTSAASAGTILTIIGAALASATRPPEIREIGITLTTAVAAEIGLGKPAANGATPSAAITVQPVNQLDAAGHTTIQTGTTGTGWTTGPTAPTVYDRRVQLPATQGAGIIWVWNPGEFPLMSASVTNLVLYQISAAAVGYDFYVKVAE